jgi:hypothetical protein
MGDIDRDSNSGNPTNMPNPLWPLYGIAKEVFAELGGGEAFIRNERAQFSTSDLRTDGEDRQRDDAEG